MFTSFQKREDQKDTRTWIDSTEFDSVKHLAEHKGVFNLSHKPDQHSDQVVKYQADWLPFDIDNKFDDGTGNIPLSTNQAIKLIAVLVTYGVPLNSIKIYASGSKGYHVLIQTRSFGAHTATENLPRYFKYMAVQLAYQANIPTTDENAYNMGQGSTMRVANRLRANSKYKIQISYDELLEIQANPSKYAELTSQPRAEWEVEPCDGKDPALDPLYSLYSEAIQAFTAPKITKPTDTTALNGKAPKCAAEAVSGSCGGSGKTNALSQTIARMDNQGWLSEADLEQASVNNATDNTPPQDVLKQIKAAQKTYAGQEWSCGYARGLQGFDKKTCPGCAIYSQAKKAEAEAKTNALVGKIFSTKAHHKALTKAIKETTDPTLRGQLFDTLIKCNAPRIPGRLSLKTAVKRLTKICPDLHAGIEATLKLELAGRENAIKKQNTISERAGVTRINCDGMGTDIADYIFQHAIAPNLPTLELKPYGYFGSCEGVHYHDSERLEWVYPKTKKTFIIDARGMNSQKTRTMVRVFKRIEQARLELWELTASLPVDDRTRLNAELGLFMAALFATHRVALTKSSAKGFGMLDYEDITPNNNGDKERKSTADIATCLNSMPKFPEVFQALFIDEARQDLNHMITSSTVVGKNGLNTRAQQVGKFNRKLKQADCIIAADADFDDFTLDYFIEVCPDHEFIILETTTVQHPATHTILSNEWHPNVKDIKEGTEHNVSRHKIKAVLSLNSRATVAATSEIEAHATFDWLGIECPDKKGLLITGDNKGGIAQAEFIQNHNAKRDEFDKVIPGTGDLHNYDYVIFTSVLGSGISLENPLFEHNFLLNTCILPNNETLQLLGRNRNAKHNYISFGRAAIDSRVVDVTAIKDAQADSLRFLAEELGLDIAVFGTTKLGDYRAVLEAATNESLNDYENSFIQLAALRGRIFEHTTRVEVDDIKLSGAVKTKLATQAFNAQILTVEEFKVLDQKSARTQEESDAVRRHKTVLMAGTTDICEGLIVNGKVFSDLKLAVDYAKEVDAMPMPYSDTLNERNGYRSKVENFELLSKDDAELFELDLKDAKSKDKRPGRVKVKRAALEVFQVLDSLDALTKQSALPICRILKKYHKELIEFGNYNKSITNFKDPVGTVKCFIEKFGYEVKPAKWHRKDGKAWRTYPFIFSEVILAYANNRAALKT